MGIAIGWVENEISLLTDYVVGRRNYALLGCSQVARSGSRACRKQGTDETET